MVDGSITGDLADMVRIWLGQAGSSSLAIWYISGNTAIFSGGSSSNAFGAVTNILDKVVSYHKSWQSENVGGDFAPLYATAVLKVFPAALDYTFYQLWQAEFGIIIE